jgi:hypothetical protein
MAFETTQTKVAAVGRAGNALGLARTIYVHMAERQELAAVIGQLNTLKADWEVNRPWIVL